MDTKMNLEGMAIEILSKLTETEKEIVKEVHAMIEENEQLSPFIVDPKSRLNRFKKLNDAGCKLKETDLFVPYILVSNSLSTIYQYNRGTGLLRGSIIVRVDDNLLYADGKYWYAVQDKGASIYKQKGLFSFTDSSVYEGRLCKIDEVKLV